MNVYGITIKGKHPNLHNQRFYGVANSIEDAMKGGIDAAHMIGWDDIEVDDVSTIGQVDFVVPDFFEENSK